MNLTQTELNELNWFTAKVVHNLATMYAPATDGLVRLSELLDLGEKVPCIESSTCTPESESDARVALESDTLVYDALDDSVDRTHSIDIEAPPQPTLWNQEGGSQSELAQAQAAHREKIGNDESRTIPDDDNNGPING